MNIPTKNRYCYKYNRHKKLTGRKLACIFDKTLALSNTWSKRGNKSDRIFKKEGSIEILKCFGLIGNIK